GDDGCLGDSRPARYFVFIALGEHRWRRSSEWVRSIRLPLRQRPGARRIGHKNSQKQSSVARSTCSLCRRQKATGKANSKPIPRSNRTIFTIFLFLANPIQSA